MFNVYWMYIYELGIYEKRNPSALEEYILLLELPCLLVGWSMILMRTHTRPHNLLQIYRRLIGRPYIALACQV